MPENRDNLIAIDAPKTDFEQFLNNERNRRIFFSGKFGVGKTFFLERFFQEHKENHDVYHLFLARYQISSNENIVEFLKYDILIELLKSYPDAFQNSKNSGSTKSLKELATALWKDHNFPNLAMKIIENVTILFPDPLFQIFAKLGRPLKDLHTLSKTCQAFKQQYTASEESLVDTYPNTTSAADNLVATDHISQLLLEKIKELKGTKKSVLIVDDLDRIDPEHIFRILNILSAHMEGDEENKFGFDHLIIVGDIDNLRSIFHHKYGEKTDFWGYFDKFFTVRPYLFNNEKAIAESMPRLLAHIKCGDQYLADMKDKSQSRNNISVLVKEFLQEYLTDALTINAITLRQLNKPLNHSFPEVKQSVFNEHHFVDQRNQGINIAITLLIALYGNQEHLLETLTTIKDNSSATPTQNQSWLYGDYASSMLQRMIELKEGSTSPWLGKYQVIAQLGPEGILGIYLVEEAKDQARFFYDTLIEYIQRSKYEKQRDFLV